MTEPPSPPPPAPSPPGPPPADPLDRPDADIRRRTRRAFAVWAAGGAAAGGAWWWLRTRSADGGIVWPLRRTHQANERVGRTLFGPTRLAPEFPAGAAAEPKTNGHYGEPAAGAAAAGWKVRVEVPGKPAELVAPADLLAGLPRTETITELKCVEGWSVVVRWGGVRFADVAKARGWPVADSPYVSFTTPDGRYYVGFDMPSAMHPQTLLCDTLDGEPLPAGHGGPLRLTTPVKYGIKNIKWIGRIAFTADRPADYWAERGYDWYAGL